MPKEETDRHELAVCRDGFEKWPQIRYEPLLRGPVTVKLFESGRHIGAIFGFRHVPLLSWVKEHYI